MGCRGESNDEEPCLGTAKAWHRLCPIRFMLKPAHFALASLLAIGHETETMSAGDDGFLQLRYGQMIF